MHKSTSTIYVHAGISIVDKHDQVEARYFVFCTRTSVHGHKICLFIETNTIFDTKQFIVLSFPYPTNTSFPFSLLVHLRIHSCLPTSVHLFHVPVLVKVTQITMKFPSSVKSWMHVNRIRSKLIITST